LGTQLHKTHTLYVTSSLPPFAKKKKEFFRRPKYQTSETLPPKLISLLLMGKTKKVPPPLYD